MKVEEIIASGLLELYALNALDDHQRREIEVLLKSSEVLNTELSLIETNLENYGRQYARRPSKNLLEGIKEKINEEGKQSTDAVRTISISKSATPWYSIAASILLLCSVAINIYYYREIKGLAQENNLLVAEKTQMANNTQVLMNEKDQMSLQLSDMVSPSLARVTMEGLEAYPEYKASVVWNEKSQRTYLSIQNMPVLKNTEQYQLWAIVDGVPVDLGVFESSTELIAMKLLKAKPEAFAVTIEPRGGSVSPTMTKMCVVGNMDNG